MRIVLVAGDRTLRQSAATMLKALGQDVVAFTAAADALRHLETDQSTDALIVAGDEGAATGAEICRKARLLARLDRPIYIGLMAGPMSSDEIIEALDRGADDVLALPPSRGELYARLRSAARLNEMQRKLADVATRDGLTGMLNRPAFFEQAARLVRDAEAPLAAIIVNIDHFKAINERYGLTAGDAALRAVARRLDGRCDLAGRLGGEEFALLLKQGDPEKAWSAAEALREDIAQHEMDIGATVLRLTCSFGVAIGDPGDDIDDLLRRADAALYVAKRAGRNLVAFYDPETPAVPNRPNSIVRCNPEQSVRPPRRVTG